MEYKLNQLDKVDAMNCGGTEYKLVSGASRLLQASVYKGTDDCQRCDQEAIQQVRFDLSSKETHQHGGIAWSLHKWIPSLIFNKLKVSL